MEEDERVLHQHKKTTSRRRPEKLLVLPQITSQKKVSVLALVLLTGLALLLTLLALNVSTTVVVPSSSLSSYHPVGRTNNNLLHLHEKDHVLQSHKNHDEKNNDNTIIPIDDESQMLAKMAKECFPLNSLEWLTADRLSNAPGSERVLATALEILLPSSSSSYSPAYQSALNQTICLEQSRFLTDHGAQAKQENNNDDNDNDEALTRSWTTRLVYLAVMFHQHYQAWPELDHQIRQSQQKLLQQQSPNPFLDNCQAARIKFGLTTNSTTSAENSDDHTTTTTAATTTFTHLDYECPKAKFLVIPLSDNGLGANLKLAAMTALKAALATGRIALFVNNVNYFLDENSSNTTANQQQITQSPPPHHRWLQRPWTLASCPRRDYQCFFAPPSPCVLSRHDYQHATLLTKAHMRTMFRQGQLLGTTTTTSSFANTTTTSSLLSDQRVVVYLPTFRPQREPPRMRQRLVQISQFLIQQGLVPDTPVIRRAIQRLVMPQELTNNFTTDTLQDDSSINTDEEADKNDESDNSPPRQRSATGFVGDDELAGGLLLYVSRPRPEYLETLDRMQQALASSTAWSTPRRDATASFLHKIINDTETNSSKTATANNDEDGVPSSIGLPIRASDKCGVESECLAFETYLHAAHDWWLHHHLWSAVSHNSSDEIRNNALNWTTIRIMVTTESTKVLQQKRNWTRSLQKPSWQKLDLELGHNMYDVTQDTGLIRTLTKTSPYTTSADDVMVSVVSSLRAQLLHHRVVLGNCCSNFHRLMQIYVRNGCSSNWDAEFVCLQDHPDEEFRLCCAWDKAERCLERMGKNATKIAKG